MLSKDSDITTVGDIFDQWFQHHFLAHAPLLLLLNSHSSHYTPNIINQAVQEGVIIFCLLPHSTHITQPLDKGCFTEEISQKLELTEKTGVSFIPLYSQCYNF